VNWRKLDTGPYWTSQRRLTNHDYWIICLSLYYVVYEIVYTVKQSIKSLSMKTKKLLTTDPSTTNDNKNAASYINTNSKVGSLNSNVQGHL